MKFIIFCTVLLGLSMAISAHSPHNGEPVAEKRKFKLLQKYLGREPTPIPPLPAVQQQTQGVTIIYPAYPIRPVYSYGPQQNQRANYEQPAYQQPSYSRDNYEKPAVQQPTYQQPAYQQPGGYEQAYQEPLYDR